MTFANQYKREDFSLITITMLFLTYETCLKKFYSGVSQIKPEGILAEIIKREGFLIPSLAMANDLSLIHIDNIFRDVRGMICNTF